MVAERAVNFVASQFTGAFGLQKIGRGHCKGGGLRDTSRLAYDAALQPGHSPITEQDLVRDWLNPFCLSLETG